MTIRAATLAVVLLAAAPAAAQDALRGTWRGGYICGQGHTALALTIEPRKDGTLTALFHFEAAADNPGVPTGCYEMEGSHDPATGRVALHPRRWLLRPPGYVMVGLDGVAAGDRMDGSVAGPFCTTFQVQRAAGPPAAEACRRGAPLLSLR